MPALAHAGTGFFAKKYAPELPTWLLIVFSFLIDLLTIIFRDEIWKTHGLSMALIWTLIFTVVSYIILLKTNLVQDKSRIKTLTFIIALLIFGHWVLDFIGWPMTVLDPSNEGTPFGFSNTPNYGLGIYKTWAGALLMDLGLFFFGIWVYLKNIKSIQKKCH